jgi:hypothetical protein
MVWWSRGFASDAAALYSLEEVRRELYLTDLQNALRGPFINPLPNPALADKGIFSHVMRSLGARTPTIYGRVGARGVAWLDEPARASDSVLALLERHRQLVLKPAVAGRREHVFVVIYDGGRIVVNGLERDEHSLRALLRNGMLVCEHVRQGAWAEKIFPATTNTLQVLTMWDDEHDEPFIARVAHRFGTSKSSPVDSFGRGGLLVEVDPATGELGAGASIQPGAGLAHHARHPETSVDFRGQQIPSWPEVRAELLGVSRGLRHVPYIGWQLVVKEDGWWVIDGDPLPDTRIQVLGPLLGDKRVQHFFRRRHVIR